MPPVGRYKLVSKSDVECLRRPLLVDGYADAERRLQVEAFTVGYIAFSDVEVAVVNHERGSGLDVDEERWFRAAVSSNVETEVGEYRKEKCRSGVFVGE